MSNRRFACATALVLTAAVLFTCVFMFYPEAVGVTAQGMQMAYEDAIFDRNEIMTVEISVNEEDWANLMANARLEEYITCDISVGGNACYQVGIRCKGNSSLSMVRDERYSFKVKFDEYVSGQTLLGLDEMVLNNTQNDATWMKEYMSYYTMDLVGVDVPLYAFANIYVNGEFWGIYLALEALEESYVMRNYGTNYGNLYKVESMDMGGGNMIGGDGNNARGGGNRQPAVPGVDTEGQTRDMTMPDVGSMPEGVTMPDMGSIPEGMTMPEDMTLPEGADGVVADGAQPADVGGTETADADATTFAAGWGNRANRGLRHMEGGFAMFSGGNGADLIYVDDEIESYSAIFTKTVLKTTTDKDKQRVIEALKGIDDLESDIEDYVDVDSLLRHIAGNAALGNSDSYFGNMMHNYYLYEKDGKVTMLPWDYNLSYGGFGGSADDLINLSIDEPFTSGSLEDRPIMERVLTDDAYKETYYSYLRTIGEFYASGEAAALVDRLDALIRESVELDPTKEYTFEEYEAAITMFKEYLELRGKSVLRQLDGDDTPVDTAGITLATLGSNMGGRGFGGGGGMLNMSFDEESMASMQQAFQAFQETGEMPENMNEMMSEWGLPEDMQEGIAGFLPQGMGGMAQVEAGQAPDSDGGQAFMDAGGEIQPGGEGDAQAFTPPQGDIGQPQGGRDRSITMGQGASAQQGGVSTENLWMLGGCAAAMALAVLIAAKFRTRRFRT